MRIRVLLGFGVFGLVLLAAALTVNAEVATFTCTVNQAGAQGSAVNVMLTDNAATPQFSKKWFKAPLGQENRILAVALAAISSSKKVSVMVDLGSAETPEIAGIYLKP